MPSATVATGIGKRLSSTTRHRVSPVSALIASSPVLLLTTSSAPRGESMTSGVLYDSSFAPRSAFHFTAPVRLSSATTYAAGS